MSYSNDVRSAKTPKEALMVIAHALDELDGRLIALESADDWDSWGEYPPQAEYGDELYPPEVKSEPQPSAGEGIAQTVEPSMGSVRIEQTANGPVYHLPTPSEEKMEQRRMLERQQLKLAQALGEDTEGGWTEAYAKGGPWWLYQHRRDIVMSYDFAVRQMMVRDVEEDSPKLAYEMSLDVLKQPAGEPDFENGSGALAIGNLTSAKVKGR